MAAIWDLLRLQPGKRFLNGMMRGLFMNSRTRLTK